MRPKHKTLRLCLLLTFLELILWLLFGVLVSSGSGDLYTAILAYCAEGFGEITIAVATTFYVAFTYGLFANSEAYRKHSTEPHLMIRWRKDTDCTDTQLSQMRLFAEEARRWSVETLGFQPNTFDETRMVTGKRYLILELTNVRKTPVGWLKLAVSGSLNIPNSQPVLLYDNLYLKDLQIGNDDRVEVTMVDLFPILHTAEVQLVIDVMTYGAVDGGDVVNESSGDSQRSAPGEFLLPESQGPQPNPQTAPEGGTDA